MLGVLRAAFGQVIARPRLVVAVYVVNVLLAIPLVVAMESVLADSIGDGIYQESVRATLDGAWYSEHTGRYDTGLGSTFTPSSVLGPGAMLDNLDAWLEGKLVAVDPSVFGMVLLWAFAWLGLQGAVLERFVHGGAAGPSSFAAAALRHLGRMLQAAAIGLLAYGMLWSLVGDWVKGIDNASIDVTSEVTMLWRLAPAFVLLVLGFHLVRLVIDYTKVAAVRERSGFVLPALVRALSMIARRPLLAVLGYLVPGLLIAAWMGVWLLVAPGGASSSWVSLILTVALTQLFIIGRLVLRLFQLATAVQVYGVAADG
ncbi:MAG: hypothetical protein AAGD38_02450 [Acidobacteriota bacterium]